MRKNRYFFLIFLVMFLTFSFIGSIDFSYSNVIDKSEQGYRSFLPNQFIVTNDYLIRTDSTYRELFKYPKDDIENQLSEDFEHSTTISPFTELDLFMDSIKSDNENIYLVLKDDNSDDLYYSVRNQSDFGTWIYDSKIEHFDETDIAYFHFEIFGEYAIFVTTNTGFENMTIYKFDKYNITNLIEKYEIDESGNVYTFEQNSQIQYQNPFNDNKHSFYVTVTLSNYDNRIYEFNLDDLNDYNIYNLDSPVPPRVLNIQSGNLYIAYVNSRIERRTLENLDTIQDFNEKLFDDYEESLSSIMSMDSIRELSIDDSNNFLFVGGDGSSESKLYKLNLTDLDDIIEISFNSYAKFYEESSLMESTPVIRQINAFEDRIFISGSVATPTEESGLDYENARIKVYDPLDLTGDVLTSIQPINDYVLTEENPLQRFNLYDYFDYVKQLTYFDINIGGTWFEVDIENENIFWYPNQDNPIFAIFPRANNFYFYMIEQPLEEINASVEIRAEGIQPSNSIETFNIIVEEEEIPQAYSIDDIPNLEIVGFNYTNFNIGDYFGDYNEVRIDVNNKGYSDWCVLGVDLECTLYPYDENITIKVYEVDSNFWFDVTGYNRTSEYNIELQARYDSNDNGVTQNFNINTYSDIDLMIGGYFLLVGGLSDGEVYKYENNEFQFIGTIIEKTGSYDHLFNSIAYIEDLDTSLTGGDYYNRMFYSTDEGISWSSTSSNSGSTFTSHFNTIAYSKPLNMIVAGGDLARVTYSYTHNISTLTDLLRTPSGTALTDVNDMIWVDELEKFIMVSDFNENNIGYSHNGLNWTLIQYTNRDLKQIEWSDKYQQLLILGSDGAVVTSEDGINYNFEGNLFNSDPEGDLYWCDVREMYITVGGDCSISYDGLEWDDTICNLTTFSQAIEYSPYYDKYLAAGGGSDRGIWYSYNGLDWFRDEDSIDVIYPGIIINDIVWVGEMDTPEPKFSYNIDDIEDITLVGNNYTNFNLDNYIADFRDVRINVNDKGFSDWCNRVIDSDCTLYPYDENITIKVLEIGGGYWFDVTSYNKTSSYEIELQARYDSSDTGTSQNFEINTFSYDPEEQIQKIQTLSELTISLNHPETYTVNLEEYFINIDSINIEFIHNNETYILNTVGEYIETDDFQIGYTSEHILAISSISNQMDLRQIDIRLLDKHNNFIDTVFWLEIYFDEIEKISDINDITAFIDSEDSIIVSDYFKNSVKYDVCIGTLDCITISITDEPIEINTDYAEYQLVPFYDAIEQKQKFRIDYKILDFGIENINIVAYDIMNNSESTSFNIITSKRVQRLIDDFKIDMPTENEIFLRAENGFEYQNNSMIEIGNTFVGVYYNTSQLLQEIINETINYNYESDYINITYYDETNIENFTSETIFDIPFYHIESKNISQFYDDLLLFGWSEDLIDPVDDMFFDIINFDINISYININQIKTFDNKQLYTNITHNFSMNEYFEDYNRIKLIIDEENKISVNKINKFIDEKTIDDIDYKLYVENDDIKLQMFTNETKTKGYKIEATFISSSQLINSDILYYGVSSQTISDLFQIQFIVDPSLKPKDDGLMDLFMGLFPDREDLTQAQALVYVLITIFLIIGMGYLFASETNNVNSPLLLPLLFVLIILLVIYFTIIQYIPVWFIVLIAIGGVVTISGKFNKIITGGSGGF